MNILVLTNLYPPEVIGGYELACGQAVEALRRRGHNVLVLTSAAREHVPPDPHVRRCFRLADIWNQYAAARRPPVVQRIMDAESRLINAFNVQMMASAIEEFRPDVAYIHNITGLGGLGLMAALQHLDVPWVWQLGDAVPSYCCGLWGKVIPTLAREFGRQARGTFIAVSSRLAEEIEELGVPLNGRVEVLPYWIDGQRPSLPRRRVRNGPLNVVSAGRLTPYKGIDALIEAVGIVRRAGYHVELDLFGAIADVDEAHYPALMQHHQVADLVTLKGSLPQTELLTRYRHYEVFAFPTWEREPFGLGPVEAAAFGGCVPLISQRCGLAEWLVHGVHCVKIEPTGEGLARAFLDLLEWRIDPEPIARRAAAVAWSDFHIDAVVPRIESLLAESASSPRGTSSGSVSEAVRLARIAESLAHSMIGEAA